MDTFEVAPFQLFAAEACLKLLLWHNWPKTAFIFFLILMLLLDMASNPVISVISVAGAVALSVSIGYTSFVWAIRKLNKSNVVDHPLKRYLEMNVTISKETANQLAHLFILKVNPVLLRLRSLFLVEDMLDSLKLLLIFCGVNIVGDYINGMTLLALAIVMLFTLPKLYDLNKKAINQQLQQFQQLKAHLMGPKNKMNTIPTATVDPQFIASDLTQKANFLEDENNANGSFISSEQESVQDSDYNWSKKDVPVEGQPHIKQA